VQCDGGRGRADTQNSVSVPVWWIPLEPRGGRQPAWLTLPLSVTVVLVTLLAARVVAVGATVLTDDAVAAADISTVTAMTDTTVSGTRMRLVISYPFLSGRPAGGSPGQLDLKAADVG
jgi:hypothetical protein